jgi:hypothetical protein
VRPRFRCLVCRRFVEGTDHGTCPGCGWEPPRTASVAHRHRSSLPLLVTVLVVLLAILAYRSASG